MATPRICWTAQMTLPLRWYRTARAEGGGTSTGWSGDWQSTPGAAGGGAGGGGGDGRAARATRTAPSSAPAIPSPSARSFIVDRPSLQS